MATTKSFERLGRVILAAVMALTAVLPARAGDWIPMLPDQNFYDFQLFAPPDLQDYEIYPEQSEGIFFNYDRLYWGITPPRVTGVAETPKGFLIPVEPISPQTIVQLNNGGILASGTNGGNLIGGIVIFGGDPLVLDLNTSWMRTAMSWGNRYEGGWMYDNRGMEFSYFDSGEQTQTFTTVSEFAASSPTQTFTQQLVPGGFQILPDGTQSETAPQLVNTIISTSPPPDHVIAQKLVQENETRVQSGGFSYLVRRQLGGRQSRSNARFGLGPRFIQLEDRFSLGYESNQYPFDVANAQANGNQQDPLQGPIGGGNAAAGFAQTSAGDVLAISGYDTLTGIGQGTALQTGNWETYTTNNMVGPEFSLLLESTQGRWTFSSGFKFTAAFNWQNNLYRGANFPDSTGADYLRATFESANDNQNAEGNPTGEAVQAPPLFLQVYSVGQTNAANSAEHEFVFSPIGEWRFGAQFRVSQAVLLRAGYTGMWMAGIARASSNTRYKADPRPAQYAEPKDPSQPASLTNPWIVKTTGPTGETPIASPYYRPDPIYNRIGANPAGGNEYVFTNGIDFGIEVKY